MIAASRVNTTFGLVVASVLCQFIFGAAEAMDWGRVYSNEFNISQNTELKGVPLRLRPIGEATSVKGTPLGEIQPKLEIKSSVALENKVKVDKLSTLDFETVGTLDKEIGGLGLYMWRGTSRDLIDNLLPQIPKTIRSPAMRSLARRLLLSTALVPVRADPNSAGKNLIALRVEQLQSMGLLRAATELISAVPNQDMDPDLLRAKVDNMLLFNDLGGACNVVRHQKNRLVENYWQRALVFCQALEGNVDGASLGANLLSEGGDVDDPVFFSLVDVLTNGREVIIESLKKPTPLHFAMLRTANIRIPPNALDRESPALLRAIGVSPNATKNLRLDAAERATIMGAMPTERLGQVYAGAKFESEELENALTLATSQRNSRGRALLYQAAVMQTVPMAKAAVLQKALWLAKEDNLYPLVVRLYEPLILDTPPLSGLAWFAADAVRALFVLNKPVEAQPWINLLKQETLRDPSAKLAVEALWAVMEITNGAEPQILNQGALDAWQAALREIEPDEADARAELGLTVLEALGYEITSEHWRSLLNDITWSNLSVPGAAVSRAMREASKAGRIGESVLLVLLALGREGPEGASPWHLYDVLVALRAIGLESDARAIALEAVISAGL